jgi:hypothetical protein
MGITVGHATAWAPIAWMTHDQILLIYCMGVLCVVALAGIRVLRLRAGRESATLWCHD